MDTREVERIASNPSLEPTAAADGSQGILRLAGLQPVFSSLKIGRTQVGCPAWQ